MVPTRPLVTQQAEYVRKYCESHVAVAQLEGAKTENASADEWRDIECRNDEVLWLCIALPSSFGLNRLHQRRLLLSLVSKNYGSYLWVSKTNCAFS